MCTAYLKTVANNFSITKVSMLFEEAVVRNKSVLCSVLNTCNIMLPKKLVYKYI